MNGNPFYVHPGGDLTQGLAGLTQQIGQIGERKRAEQAQQEAEQRAQEIKSQALAAYQSNDPNQLAEFMINHPSVAKEMNLADMQAHKNKATLENSRDSSYRFLADPSEENLTKLVDKRKTLLTSQGVPPEQQVETDKLLNLFKADPEKAINQVNMRLAGTDTDRWTKFQEAIGKGGEEVTDPVAVQEFNILTEGLSEEEKEKAKRIKLGLDPRATGSASQTILQLGNAKEIAEVERALAEGKSFGDKTGLSRANAIDKGFERIQNISQNVLNLDKAISYVKEGAGTGAVERRFPSIRSSSVALDQIQGQLALDVIGSVTFGALSKGELDLAKAVAIPTGLEGDKLVDWLEAKKVAQQKLLTYFQEQVDFLDQGGTVAGFLRMKKREQGGDQQAQSNVIRFDSQGNIIQ